MTNALHYYTTPGKNKKETAGVLSSLIKADKETYFDPSLFMSNLNFSSNIFRHSLRVAFSLLAGFLVYGLIKSVTGLRLSQEEEYEGADFSIHRIGATPDREADW